MSTSRRSRPAESSAVEIAFRLARERYAALGVNVESALTELASVSVSLHCWQGDDVGGFENLGSALGAGLAVTGHHPGRARTPDELRADLAKALSLIPGRHRVNLHAIYGDFEGKRVDRNAIQPEHFDRWIAWARDLRVGLDFNPTCFAHPNAAGGYTLAHSKKEIRRFWIEHCVACRRIGFSMGKALGTPCVTNLWIPDGFKDTPADRQAPRERLLESLDAVFKVQFPKRALLDAVEPKLFGIGTESYTVGSHEFYLGYAITRQKLLCLDAGHFHPTESLADKISSVLLYVPGILLHVSRGVRWDSDHVVTFTDELQAIAREVIASGHTDRIHLGLDYFDASINRLAAWVIGTRNLLRAMLLALLEPPAIGAAESSGDYTSRLALQEEARCLPVGAVWDYYCQRHNVPVGESWLAEVKQYEKRVLSNRSSPASNHDTR